MKKKQIGRPPVYSLWSFNKNPSYEIVDKFPIVYLILDMYETQMRYVIFASKENNTIEKILSIKTNPENDNEEFDLEIQKIIDGKGGKEYSVITNQHEAYKKFIFYGEQNNVPYFKPSLTGCPTESFKLLKEWYAKNLKVEIERNYNESIDKNEDENILVEIGFIDALIPKHKILCEPKTDTGAWRKPSEIIANKKFVKWLSERKKELTNDDEPQNQTNETLQHTKLTWNGQKNVLTDIFYQLKRTYNNKQEPLLPNSNEDIALFLKNNFECFSDTAISTIIGMLKTKERPRKTEKRFLIDCK